MTDRLGTQNISDAVLRLRNVNMTKVALESALGIELDRYEPARDGSEYAQIDIPHSDNIWKALVDFAHQKGPALLSLRDDGKVGSIGVDLAVMFRDAFMGISFTVPSEAAAILGRYGIEIEFSIYRASD
jgi:hypothetical protein